MLRILFARSGKMSSRIGNANYATSSSYENSSNPRTPKLRSTFLVSNTPVRPLTYRQRSNLTYVATHSIDLLRDASTGSKNTSFLRSHFLSDDNIDAFLCGSSLFDHASPSTRTPAATQAERQLSAQLHILYGLSVESPVNPVFFARLRVYDCAVRSQIACSFRNDNISKTRLTQVSLKAPGRNGCWLLLNRAI
jgi:hypothetical protein